MLQRLSGTLFVQEHTEGETPEGPDLGNLANCVEEAKRAALDGDNGPADPTDYRELRERLETARDKLPPLYREAVWAPYVKTLDELGKEGFAQLLLRDPERTGIARLMFDIAHAILQNGDGYQSRATDAFQEVVSDLYDGFLSAGDRRGVEPPDKSGIPPLVKWGHPQFGPYTWPVDSASVFGIRTGIVSLPPANARLGVLAWAALGHETSGHDILHADTGLLPELSRAVKQTLVERQLGHPLADYWASRIDETASDVLGILNMGPSAGVGLIGYFRALNAAWGGTPSLRNDGPAGAPHPADILRGYLAAATVRLLPFDGADEWGDLLEQETDKDLTQIRLEGRPVSVDAAKASAAAVAETIVGARMESLEQHALGDIQTWRNQDEEIVARLRPLLTTPASLPRELASGIYAAHVVAAAVTAAVSRGADLPVIFERMLCLLKAMHDANPSWGPLYVVHPGDIAPHVVYRRVEPVRTLRG